MVRILLVEDNPAFRESLKQGISTHFPAIIVEEADSGEEALEKVNGNPPHLIFMDLRLPGINGLQTTRRIKKAFPEIRIAMLTGYDVQEYKNAALDCGADCFFVKQSLKWDDVHALLQTLLKTS
jgi:DNA-binding NarL/FixJ family response regulator